VIATGHKATKVSLESAKLNQLFYPSAHQFLPTLAILYETRISFAVCFSQIIHSGDHNCMELKCQYPSICLIVSAICSSLFDRLGGLLLAADS